MSTGDLERAAVDESEFDVEPAESPSIEATDPNESEMPAEEISEKPLDLAPRAESYPWL